MHYAHRLRAGWRKINTIYQPGFSTKDEVSDVSGRGIGMDVVRESIENLKGVIELQTAPGRGTRFLIRLPLTLAILRAVLVEVVISLPTFLNRTLR